jgi:hypothetical protein
MKKGYNFFSISQQGTLVIKKFTFLLSISIKSIPFICILPKCYAGFEEVVTEFY